MSKFPTLGENFELGGVKLGTVVRSGTPYRASMGFRTFVTPLVFTLCSLCEHALLAVVVATAILWVAMSPLCELPGRLSVSCQVVPCTWPKVYDLETHRDRHWFCPRGVHQCHTEWVVVYSGTPCTSSRCHIWRCTLWALLSFLASTRILFHACLMQPSMPIWDSCANVTISVHIAIGIITRSPLRTKWFCTINSGWKL